MNEMYRGDYERQRQNEQKKQALNNAQGLITKSVLFDPAANIRNTAAEKNTAPRKIDTPRINEIQAQAAFPKRKAETKNFLYEKYIPALQAPKISDNSEPVEKVREATFKDLTLGSFERGRLNSIHGQESYNDMMGMKNKKDEYENLLKDDKYNFKTDGKLKKAVSGASELAGQMFHQATAPESVASGLSAAGAAAALGNAGPQALVPEEIITVPGAFFLGVRAGSTYKNFQIEAGHAYNEMIENGISPSTAKKIALGVGAGNAALEQIQLDELIKGFKVLNKSGADTGFLKKLGKYLAGRGIDTAKETGQEMLQEGVTIAGVNLANKIDKGNWVYDWKDIGNRLAETGKSSMLAFGLAGVTGDVAKTGVSSMAPKKAAKPTAPSLVMTNGVFPEVTVNSENGTSKLPQLPLANEEMAAANEAARAVGTKVKTAEQTRGTAAKGKYEHGTVYLTENDESPTKTVFANKMMRHLKENAPETYDTYVKMAIDTLSSETGMSRIELWWRKKAQYAKHGIELSVSGAEDELVSDFNMRILSDPNKLTESIKNAKDLNELQKSILVYRTRNAIKHMADQLENYSRIADSSIAPSEISELRNSQQQLERIVAEKAWNSESRAGTQDSGIYDVLKDAGSAYTMFDADRGVREGGAPKLSSPLIDVEAVVAPRRSGVDNGGKSGIIKVKNSELKNALSIKGVPNSIVDKTDDNGKVLQRRIYGDDGRAKIDFDTGDHNMSSSHPTGAHRHVFDYSRKNPRGIPMPLTDQELEENSDIIKRGENYHD